MATIEVFADVACPFTHVGLVRFVEHRARLGRDDVRLRVRSWPLEIVNGRPLDPHFIAEEVDEIREQIDRPGFVGFREGAFPNTSIPALALTTAAYEIDDSTGERVALTLRDLLFERGVGITDPAVLGAIASEHGVIVEPRHRDQVAADHAEGVRRGVVGSPHFFTPAGSFFCPSLQVRRDEAGHLVVTMRDEFDAFIDSCLAS